jgi:large subunit ribosomal protein L36e
MACLLIETQLAYASQIVYGPLIFITKLSILLFYLRVFAPAAKSKTLLSIRILIWGNSLFYLAGTLLKIFQCTPISKVWDRDIQGRCLQIEIPILIASAINAVSDFSILLLPLVCVWRLRMKTARKLGVSAMFLAGSL